MNEQFSADGQWWWNGREWIPASQAPKQSPTATRPPPGAELLARLLARLVAWVSTLPARVMASRHRNLILMSSGLFGLMVIAFFVALASNPQFQQGNNAGQVAAPPTATPLLFDPNAQRAPDPTPISTPTPTAASTPTPAPTAKPPPPPPPAAPQPLSLQDRGSKVKQVHLDAGRYKLSWSAQGHDNFQVELVGDQPLNLVNEIPPDPNSGETLVTVKDTGDYIMNVKASTLTWSITFTKL